MKHCETCTCETPGERSARLQREHEQREREEREREYAKRHSVLTDEDIAWARRQLPGAAR